MRLRVPQLSQPLLEAWTRVLGPMTGGNGDEPPSELCRAVCSLSERFTRERPRRDAAYLEEASARRAYLAYYFPVNLAKMQALLGEMPEPVIDPAAPAEPFRVLDVGSGPGTAVLGLLDWVHRHPYLGLVPVHLVAVDASSRALQDCERVWRTYVASTGSTNAELVTVRGDIERFGLPRKALAGGQPYDLIIMANVLNEL